eukprot:CAMPEP_0118944818 /NCGR_PEP_ID=MMETSP1169-20130426/41078_1 /TAXON_ID=36882 /ORGANISM="Pyramimonas obovata, Strain CCMP722" /LENGTH=232 /DNA_ID=CAMNT_0006890383 /DNA_START=391 /DNA_END=1085 /DNA_ORIENTATION=-
MSVREPDVVVTVRLHDKEERAIRLYEDVHTGGPGGRLWDASALMAHHLAERVDGSLSDARVIEIGAGLGLPGIVAALQGAHVTLTDKERCVDLLWLNAEANGVADRVEVVAFEWGRKPRGLKPPYDVVLLSDCICHDENFVFRPLLKTLKDVSGPASEILVSYKRRSPTEDKFWTLAEEVFDIALVECEEVPSLARDGDDLGVGLYRLRLRQSPPPRADPSARPGPEPEIAV